MIEVLTAISIIAMLLAMFFPALQAAREAGRQTVCRNNLRQVAMAVLSYESLTGELPSNGWGFRWIGDPDRGNGPKQPGGWIYQITPHLERPDLADLGRGADPAQKRALLGRLTQISLAIQTCPSRSPWAGPPPNPIWAPFNAEFFPSVGRCDYAINEGDRFVGGTEGPLTLAQGDDPNYRWTDTSRATGVSFLRSQITAANIRDGLGSTYLVGEKYRTLDGGEDPGYDQSMFSGVDLDINRWTYEPPTRDGTNLRAIYFSGATRFGSSHSAVCFFAFCDASVRGASFKIDPEIHRRLGTRAEMAFADPTTLR